MLEKQQLVLIEKIDQSRMAHGYGEHYLPVTFPTKETATNRFRKVVLNQLETSEPPTMLGSKV